MLQRFPIVAGLLAAAIPGQNERRTFLPAAPILAEYRIDDLPALLAAWPGSPLGKLYAEADVRTASDLAAQRLLARLQRGREVFTAAVAMGVEPERTMPGILDFTPQDLRDASWFATLPPGEGPSNPRMVTVLTTMPRTEGRVTRIVGDHVARLGRCAQWRRRDDVKVEGVPVDAFTQVLVAAEEEQDQDHSHEMPSAWIVHLPGTFVFGEGTPAECGVFGPAPLVAGPGVSLAMHFGAYLAMFGRMGGGVPASFSSLGFDELQTFQWRLSFAGERVLDEMAVEFTGAPGGFVGALLAGTAPLPAQPLPAGALAQVRCAIDFATAFAALKEASGGELAVPPEIEKEMLAAFSGGLAFGAAAPAKGGVIPRLFLSLGLADPTAFARLQAALPAAGMPTKSATYDGVECTVLAMPGLPAAMQPVWCVRDGVLHAAESPRSLRALLAALRDGGEAMDVGDLPVPEGRGELLPTLDVRYDVAAIYAAFHELWLPLFELIPRGPFDMPGLLRREEMPEPEAVAALLGKGRGVLRRDGQRYVLQQHGALGGLPTTAFALTYAPMLSAQIHDEWATEDLLRRIAARKLEVVWTHLSAFRDEHKRWPKDLGELFADRRIPSDALLLPGDASAEPVALAAGDARQVLSSFRYFATPVAAPGQAGDDEARLLLVAIAPRGYDRPALADDGKQPNLWGEASQCPIDKFAK